MGGWAGGRVVGGLGVGLFRNISTSVPSLGCSLGLSLATTLPYFTYSTCNFGGIFMNPLKELC